jgi:hypothetical protein
MAKSNGDTNKIRDEEVEVETRAAYAGGGDDGDGGEYKMPNVTSDSAMERCQAAADAARSYNEGSESGSVGD